MQTALLGKPLLADSGRGPLREAHLSFTPDHQLDFHSYEDLPQMDLLAHVHNTTGKPILLGEFSFIAWDSNSNLPNN